MNPCVIPLLNAAELASPTLAPMTDNCIFIKLESIMIDSGSASPLMICMTSAPTPLSYLRRKLCKTEFYFPYSEGRRRQEILSRMTTQTAFMKRRLSFAVVQLDLLVQHTWSQQSSLICLKYRNDERLKLMASFHAARTFRGILALNG